VKDFDNGLLTIVADDGVWKSELLLRKGQILSKINKALGTRMVKDIRIGSGK
jgi:predicted nucleic acid-binding Zn ribbon protein